MYLEYVRSFTFHVSRTSQTEKRLHSLVDTLKVTGCERTTVISALHYETWGMQWLAPYSAVSLGEHFMREGKNAIVVLEGMSDVGFHTIYSCVEFNT